MKEGQGGEERDFYFSLFIQRILQTVELDPGVLSDDLMIEITPSCPAG